MEFKSIQQRINWQNLIYNTFDEIRQCENILDNLDLEQDAYMVQYLERDRHNCISFIADQWAQLNWQQQMHYKVMWESWGFQLLF